MHLRCLEELVKAFINSEPYSLGVEPVPHPDAAKYNNWHVFVRDVAPVPQEIGLVAGDFLTNLRASLDHLAWELVLANGGKPSKGTTFPIKEKPTPLQIAGGVTAAALAKIEAAQPYKRPDGGTVHTDRLWMLNELVNIDKHRHLLLTIMGYEAGLLIRGGQPVWSVPMLEPIPLQANAPVFVTAFGTLPEKVDMDADLTTGVFLSKGEPGGTNALIPLFDRLLKRVRDEIIPSFAGLWAGG